MDSKLSELSDIAIQYINFDIEKSNIKKQRDKIPGCTFRAVYSDPEEEDILPCWTQTKYPIDEWCANCQERQPLHIEYMKISYKMRGLKKKYRKISGK